MVSRSIVLCWTVLMAIRNSIVAIVLVTITNNLTSLKGTSDNITLAILRSVSDVMTLASLINAPNVLSLATLESSSDVIALTTFKNTSGIFSLAPKRLKKLGLRLVRKIVAPIILSFPVVKLFTILIIFFFAVLEVVSSFLHLHCYNF